MCIRNLVVYAYAACASSFSVARTYLILTYMARAIQAGNERYFVDYSSYNIMSANVTQKYESSADFCDL